MRSLFKALSIFGLLAVSPLLFGVTAKKDLPVGKESRSFNDLFPGLEFRCIGPYRGGRSIAVAGVRHRPLTFYFGGTGGGVWKTTDGGSNWQSVSDKTFKTGSVGAIAVSESDPNVVYVGMGESHVRGNVSHGDGVYKSTDGGHTWKNVGLRDTRQIARVRIDPADPDLVYVAALGHIWGANAERGVFRSRDGGRTWSKVLSIDEKTGASDLAMDPTNPRILYAGFWQVVRRPWELVSGGPGSSLWRSTDGGDTWKKLSLPDNEGLPEGIWGKVGVAASAAKPGRVYAFIEAGRGGLFVSEDYGEKWKHVNDEHKIRERAWYYSWVYADPENADTVYLPNVYMHKSTDGGKSFSNLKVPHGDNHDLWIDPDDPDRMILGNDGGATITFNGGQTWSTQNNQPTAQFYRVITDNQFPYWVYGSQQDNSNVAIPSGVAGSEGIDATDWHPVGGGESGWMAPDPTDPQIVYAGEYGGQITRYDHRTRQARQIMAWPQLADGHATKDLKYRFQWNAPILISPNDPRALYHASQKLLRSRDGGETWEEISPDLTRNDPAKQGKSGGPITIDVTGVEVYDTIFALAESKFEPGVIWAGTDDGLVHVTRDNGKTWQNVTPAAMPEWIQVNAIDLSAHQKGTAYVAATRYKFDDFHPYLYKTTDYGKSWARIDRGIPEDAFTRVVREDPGRRGLLFAGTETGLYVSTDDGASWKPFQRNLPAVPITDLTFKDGDLVVATQGRSFWILDDLTPLRNWSDSMAGETAHLFTPRPAVRIQTQKRDEEEELPAPIGSNIPNGVIVDYWLKEKPGKGEGVTLEFLAGDKVIRTFSSEKREPEGDLKEQAAREEEEKEKDKPLEPKAGVNRFVWDMRVFKPTLVPKAVFNEGEKAPPKVGPGVYKVRLTAGGRSLTETFEVRPHPAGFATVEDLKAQYDLLSAIRDRLSETHATVAAVRDLRAQTKDLGERAERMGKGDELKKRAASIGEKLTAVEEKLTNPNIKSDEDALNYEPKLDHDFTYLAGIVASADAKPTPASVAYYDLLKGRLDTIGAEYRALLDGDVADFNRAVEEAKLPRTAPAPKLEKTP
ncbi:MAG TPA: glycosyl hydrolase [Thermoanaerobaculia bacterium]|nr:glycosyl hydrolase [Thermoanaerobaculia bacterium]